MSAQPSHPSAELPRPPALAADLLETIAEVVASADLKGLGRAACRAARILTGASVAALALREDDGRWIHLEVPLEPLFGARPRPPDHSLAQQAMVTGVPQVIQVDAETRAALGLVDGGVRTLLAVTPNRRDDEPPSAALVVGWGEDLAPSAELTASLRGLADVMSVAVAERAIVDRLERRVLARAAALRRARDTAETANRVKTAFLANTSHELRTPLNAIMGFSQLSLADRGLGAVHRSRFAAIRRGGAHLLRLISDILDMARIEAGRIQLVDVDFAIEPLLAEVVEVVAGQVAAKGLTLQVAVDPEVPASVRSDATRLRQVLTNLLGNAVKFTAEGSVAVAVGWREGRGTFRVEDTGPGVAPEEVASIFRPFSQAGDPARRAEGTGLGLAIADQLVTAMGGSLQLETELGAGCAFSFDLPLPAASRPAAPSRKAVLGLAEIEGYEGRRLRVLIVDDSAENRAVLSDALSPRGFAVEEAEDGRAALAAIEARRPDLVLLDLVMPGLDGFGVLDALRASETGASLPVVVVSADAAVATRRRAREAGSSAFLAKPVDFARLFAVLRRKLGLTWLLSIESSVDVGAQVQTGASVPDVSPAAPGTRLSAELPLEPELAVRIAEAARRGDVGAVDSLLAGAGSSPRLERMRQANEAFQLDDVVRLASGSPL